MRYILIFITLFFITAYSAVGQEIDFGKFYSEAGFSITLEVGTSEDGNLSFGSVASDSGTHLLELGDEGMANLRIRGVKYLDVYIDISGDTELVLDGDESETISFTMQAAYSNVGQGSNHTDYAIEIPISSNMGAIRIPVLSSRLDDPAGPPLPPPPPTGDMDTESEEYFEYVELYFYGSINVGNVAAGEYNGTIDISVSYEESL